MPLGNEDRDKFLNEKNGTFHIIRGELGLLFSFYQWKLHDALVCSLFDTQFLSDYVTSKFSVCGCCGFHHRSHLQRKCSLSILSPGIYWCHLFIYWKGPQSWHQIPQDSILRTKEICLPQRGQSAGEKRQRQEVKDEGDGKRIKGGGKGIFASEGQRTTSGWREDRQTRPKGKCSLKSRKGNPMLEWDG